MIHLFFPRTIHTDFFLNPAQQTDPTATVKDDIDLAAANNNYIALLMFIQKNPGKSAKFIEDIKQKFFNDTCAVKDTIDFNHVAQLPSGMIF